MSHELLFDTHNEEFITAGTWSRESTMDRTVLKYPEIVSRLLTDGADYAAVALAGADFGGPQLLKIDALFLLDEGDAAPELVIWESKRTGNVHPRLLIGQVLDYASALAALTPDEFAQELSSRTSQKLWRDSYEAAFRRRKEPVRDIGFIEERACEAHRAGRFRLVVCAEDLPKDVVRMSAWLTSRMASADLVAAKLGPVGSRGWIRAAALLDVVQGNVERTSLDKHFDEAVRRLQGVQSAEFVPVKVQGVADATFALSVLAERPKARRSPSAAAISPDAWRATADVPMLTLYDLLLQEFPESVADWHVGTRALLLYVKAGDQVVEALRLFDNRVYFVSAKDLLDLGAADDARWWRSALSEFPVTDANAKQPVVAGPNVVALLEQGDRLVVFLRELQERAVRAASMGG